MDDHEGFRRRLEAQFADADMVERAIRSYFADAGQRYTGSQFELLCDNSHRDLITSHDLVAVSSLSVSVPVRPALWILGDDGRKEIAARLAEVPSDLDIWDDGAEPLVARDGPLWQAWDLLGQAYWPEPRRRNGMGRTRRSKLLAAKRPRLVPVLDDVVCSALGPSDDYWADFRHVLRDARFRRRIDYLTAAAPGNVTLLRRIDVVVWMRHKDGFAGDPGRR